MKDSYGLNYFMKKNNLNYFMMGICIFSLDLVQEGFFLPCSWAWGAKCDPGVSWQRVTDR